MKKNYIYGIIFLISLVSVIAVSNNVANIDMLLSTPVSNNVANIEFLDNVTAPLTDACTYSGSGTWNIYNTQCNITIATNIKTNNLYISNSTVIISASITNYTIKWIGNNSVVRQQ